MFISVACRGRSVPEYSEVRQTSGSSMVSTDTPDAKPMKVNGEADFLTLYSTTPGSISARTEQDGTPFVKALCAQVCLRGSNHEQCLPMVSSDGRDIARTVRQMRGAEGRDRDCARNDTRGMVVRVQTASSFARPSHSCSRLALTVEGQGIRGCRDQKAFRDLPHLRIDALSGLCLDASIAHLNML